MDAPAVEEGCAGDQKRVGPLVDECCEGRVDLAARAGPENLNLQPHNLRDRLQFFQRRERHRVGWIDAIAPFDCRPSGIRSLRIFALDITRASFRVWRKLRIGLRDRFGRGGY